MNEFNFIRDELKEIRKDIREIKLDVNILMKRNWKMDGGIIVACFVLTVLVNLVAFLFK